MLATDVSAKSLLSHQYKSGKKNITVDKQTKRVVANKVEPGDVIFYTLSYVNSGDEAATNAVLDDPIRRDPCMLPAAPFGDGAEISFSIDGGKTFKKPSLLTYEVELPGGKVEKRTASAEQYTHIRWTISMIPAHGSGQVGFQVRVK